MTADSKWAIGLSAFSICVLLGLFLPFLWIIFLILMVVLLSVPTAKKNTPAVPVVTATALASAPPSDISGIRSQLEALLQQEQDEKVRQGIVKSLEVVTTFGQAVSPVAVQPIPQPVVSQAELDERKHRQELRNINTILYTASFLLVGAAALFIGFNDWAGPMLKFVTLLLVAVAFYAVGLQLHSNSLRLRPAAVAFVGTGLALIPFVGLALNSFVLHDPSLSWWITSIFGLVAFLAAVSEIRATAMNYLTLAFFFSLATSSVSVLDAPFVWYFVSIIITSTFMMYASYKQVALLPESFKVPLEQNAQLATPIALIGSMFMLGTFGPLEYTIITGVAALHYLVNALGFSTDRTRLPYWTAARALTIVFAASFTQFLFSDTDWTAFVVVVAAILSHGYSVVRLSKDKWELGWLWAAQGLVVLSMTAWYDNMAAISGALSILLAMSVHQLYVSRRVELSIAGIIAALALPFSLLIGVLEPPMETEHIAMILMLGSIVMFAVRALLMERHVSFQIASAVMYVCFAVESILTASVSAEWAVLGWLLFVASGLAFAASYTGRQPWILTISSFAGALAVPVLYFHYLKDDTWAGVLSGLTLAAVWYGLSIFFRKMNATEFKDGLRADIMAMSAIIALSLWALVSMFGADDIVISGTLLGCLAAGLVALEGWTRKSTVYYEISLYLLTFSLQRMVGYSYPDTDWLVYTHWWALTGGIVALIQYNRTHDRSSALTRGILSLCMLSLPTGLAALGSGEGYKLVFLLEHAFLAMAGLAFQKKLAVQWGSIGVGLSVLYMLQGYTYLLLTLVALLLILFAVWRLAKKG